jgi:hypothetical protein
MTDKTSKADDLIEAGPDAPITLSDADMDKGSGGRAPQKVTNKTSGDPLKFNKG